MSNEMVPGRLYVISAPSGAGKTSLTHTLIERLSEHHVPASFSVSFTTRAPRPGERDGVDYHFVSPEEFERMAQAGEFLEHARVFGRCYGTGLAKTRQLLQRGRDVVMDIDWQGAAQVRNTQPEATSIFILPPSRQELERRLRLRAKDDESVIATRLREAAEEMSHYQDYDYLVVNDDFEQAARALESIFVSRRLERNSQLVRLAPTLVRLLG